MSRDEPTYTFRKGVGWVPTRLEICESIVATTYDDIRVRILERHPEIGEFYNYTIVGHDLYTKDGGEKLNLLGLAQWMRGYGTINNNSQWNKLKTWSENDPQLLPKYIPFTVVLL